MKERGILFSAGMVRALLAGTKTQTRRAMKPQPADDVAPAAFPNPETQGWRSSLRHEHGPTTAHFCPYGAAGDRLWVREAYRLRRWALGEHGADLDRVPPSKIADSTRWYEADPLPFVMASEAIEWGKYRPGMFMLRPWSRITLEITGVRVERLQSISPEDAIAEGLKAITKDGRTIKYGIADADGLPGTDDTGWRWADWRISPVDAYRRLWEQINGRGSWDANPWVWAVSFRHVSGEQA